MVEGLRGFIPASRLSLSYIEDLESYLLKDIEVQVIDVDQANNRLVLSARELLKEKEAKEREAKIASIKIGSVLTGTVESLQTYGAFITLEDDLSGLVHICLLYTSSACNLFPVPMLLIIGILYSLAFSTNAILAVTVSIASMI